MIHPDARILAVIVTYHPATEALRALIGELKSQADEILVVDNTPANDDAAWNTVSGLEGLDRGLRMVRLGGNRGIATALNVGIGVGVSEGFTHVLLSDQDSLPEAGMVAGMLEAERIARDSGSRVGAVGPVFRDRVTRMEYPFQVTAPRRLFYSSKFATDASPDISTLCLITSGCLIPVDTIDRVGDMLDGLFIDHVDVEWCHRAISKGYVLIGSNRGVMRHNMGDSCIRVWVFGWRALNGYGPVRLYYRFRNFVHLLRMPYIGFAWKVRASWYWAGNFYGHAFFGDAKVANLVAMLSGLADGLRGKWGKREESDA